MRLAKIVAVGVTVLLLASGAFYFFRSNHPQEVRPSASRLNTAVPTPIGDIPPPLAALRKAIPALAGSIHVENGMLSLNLEDQPLGSVLAEISKRSHVNIYSSSTIDTNPVTSELSNVPLDQGLQSLLRNYDVFILQIGRAAPIGLGL